MDLVSVGFRYVILFVFFFNQIELLQFEAQLKNDDSSKQIFRPHIIHKQS